VAKQRSEAEKQVADLLVIARESLHLSLSFLTRMDGTTQHLEVVESAIPLVFKDGITQRQETSFCQAVSDGRLPAVMPNIKAFPEAMKLPAARWPRLRSFVSVPVVLSDGTMYGTFCAAGFTADKELTKRDKALMDVLARAAAVIIEPGVRARARAAEIEHRLGPILDSGGPAILFQPIIELATGARVGAEALSRFPREWDTTPDVVFGEAHSVGQGHRLELLAMQRAADYLDEVTGYVAMNVSPATLLTPECAQLLGEVQLDRVLLELSEHDQVADYGALQEVLGPLRAAGMRLAIDDVGAGSSLRHILLTTPDVIKLDRSIVDGVSADPVLRSLVRSLVDFAEGCDASVVAEGVETAADGDVLLTLGVDYGQGWYYGRPGPAADMPAAAAIHVGGVPRPNVGALRPPNVGAVRHGGTHDDFTARSSHRDLSST
jgi:EAL domain-containing protein (putative c-di-GMP-specific phosphodiesterase class I)